jgi:hypothetical protein
LDIAPYQRSWRSVSDDKSRGRHERSQFRGDEPLAMQIPEKRPEARAKPTDGLLAPTLGGAGDEGVHIYDGEVRQAALTRRRERK